MGSGDQGEAVAVARVRGGPGFGHSWSVEKRVTWRYMLERKSTGLAVGRGDRGEQTRFRALIDGWRREGLGRSEVSCSGRSGTFSQVYTRLTIGPGRA